MAGLYYNPPSPHIGGRQPLEPPRLVPASGPAPTPPPTTGALIAQAIIDAWRPPPPGPYLAEQPNGNELISPPVSGPAPTNPPFMGGSRLRSEILISWLPPAPGPYFDMEQPYMPAVMPPQAAAAVARVPIGARIGQDVLDSWLPAAPGPYTTEQPYALEVTVPPTSGPAPQNPPFVGGARISREVLNAWIPPAPPPPVAVLLDPPISGQTPQNPPFVGGAQIRAEILIAWLPPAPGPYLSAQPYNDVTVSPPQSADRPIVGAGVAEAILVSWQLPPVVLQPQAQTVQQAVAAQYVPPAARVMPFWAPADPLPTLPEYAEQPAPVPQFSQLIGWGWSEPESYPAIVTTPSPVSGSASSPPPIKGGAKVPDAVLISWLPPAPQPPVTQPGVKQGVAPSAPPLGGGGLPATVMLSWQAPAWIIVADNTMPASADRPIAGLPNAILTSWQTAAPALQPVSYAIQQPIAAPYVPPGPRILLAWATPDPAFQSSIDVDPPRSGPVPSNPPIVGGSSALQAIYAAWNAPLPQAVVTNANLVLGVVRMLVPNPRYILGYSQAPIRVLGYSAKPIRNLP